jgi:Protein of unknown function (DUF402)
MADTNRWKFGDTVVFRGILKGKLWYACPAYIVEDNADMIALYWRVGTSIRAPIRRPTVEDELYNRIVLEDRQWVYNDVLSLHLPGRGFCIDLMWFGGTRDLRCWYVHLQEPLRRSKIGFDSMDQMLDIVIRPDRSNWQWKDEDEFNQAGRIGVYSPEKMTAIRAEGECVIALLEANASPFCDGWEHWTPPAAWTIPQFPPGWENFPAA